MTEATLQQIMTMARHEHLVPGREIHMEDMSRLPVLRSGSDQEHGQDNAVANIWNTTGACDPTPEQFDRLDADAIAGEDGALRAWLNPVRYCMFDQLDVWEAGDDRTFGAITGTWTGATGAADDDAGHCLRAATTPATSTGTTPSHSIAAARSTFSTPLTGRCSSCSPSPGTGTPR